ncbi:MAG: hypothetical protein SVS15_01265 [Thermodesulfobacteriota bacterium]|nr:hypothetical protein [Thermodesulfobacteriota bacterium]
MQKLNKEIEEWISNVTVYLSDLKSIYDILKEISNEVEITTDDFRYDTIEEMVKHGPEIRKVKFSISNPSIYVSISKHGVLLNSLEDSLRCIGIITKIRTILLKRKRYIDDFFANKGNLFIILLNSILIFGLIFKENPTILSILLILFIIFSLFFYMDFILTSTKNQKL